VDQRANRRNKAAFLNSTGVLSVVEALDDVFDFCFYRYRAKEQRTQ